MAANVYRYLSLGGFLESCQSNAFVFSDAELHDALLYMDTPSQNILFGSVSNVPSAMRIDSNMVHFNYNQATSNAVGIGISNFLLLPTPHHRLNIAGPASNSVDGPHTAYYRYESNGPSNWITVSNTIVTSNLDLVTGFVTVTSNQIVKSNIIIDPDPIEQHLVLDHDDVTRGLDAYWTGSNWNSAHDIANYRVQKSNARYIVWSACNVPKGDAIPETDFRAAWTITSNSFIGIGTTDPHQRITVRAEDANDLGPHMLFYTDADSNYPLFQLQNWSHDDVSVSFDAYRHSNVWISSSSNGNFQLIKRTGRLSIMSACNVSLGDSIDAHWYPALTVGSNSYLGIGTSCNVSHRVSVVGPSNSLRGPHFAFFVDDNLRQPAIQYWVDRHDQTSVGFDTYWDGSNWLASYSNALPGFFKLEKSNGLFRLDAACTPSDVVDAAWSNAWTVVASNNYVGVRWQEPLYPLDVHGDAAYRSNLYVMSNLGVGTGSAVTHRVSVVGPSNSLVGPHLAFFVGCNLQQPAIQHWVDRHDQTTVAFDTYWDGSNWLASYSNALPGFFKFEKSNGLFRLDAACTGSNAVDAAWSNAWTVIASNNYVGIRTEDPLYPLDVHGDAMFRSNVYHLSNVLPRSNKTYDLGAVFDDTAPASNMRWRNLFLGTDGANEGRAGFVDFEDVRIHRDFSIPAGGLKMYNTKAEEPARLWVKEILLGDPKDLFNGDVYLLVACNNGIQLQNASCNMPPQDFSQLNNLFVAPTRVGIGLSNMEHTFHVIGDMQLEPFRVSALDAASDRILSIDIDQLSSRETTVSTWGNSLSAVGQPERLSMGGYYNGPHVACTWAQNYFVTRAPITMAGANAGFTAVAMVRFGDVGADVGAGNEDVVFALSNVGNVNRISLKRLGASPTQLTFETDDAGVVLQTPSNTVSANEWAVYTVRYDQTTQNLELFKNINYVRIDLVNTHQPISTRPNTDIDPAKPNLVGVVGRGNLDLMHLVLYDRVVGGEELLDLQRQLVYRSFPAARLSTKEQPYPPDEVFRAAPDRWRADLGLRDGQPAYVLTDRSGPYASGTWTAWASSTQTPDGITYDGAYAVFSLDTDPLTGSEWATADAVYTADPISFTAASAPAVTVTLECPTHVVVESYTLRASRVAARTPRTWTLQGSWDCKKWFVIDARDDQTWTSRELKDFRCACIEPCRFVRLAVTANGATVGGAGDRVSLSSLRLYGRDVGVQVDGSGFSVGTPVVDQRCVIEGHQRVSGSQTLGRRRLHPLQGASTWPSASARAAFKAVAAASNVASLTRTIDRVMSVQVTSSTSTSSPLRAFDGEDATSWTSLAGVYNATTGLYTGVVTTQGLSGEWLQFVASRPFRLASYRIRCSTVVGWAVFGSADSGASWTLLDQVSGAVVPYDGTRYVSARSRAAPRMDRYRLVVTKTTSAITSASVSDWRLISEDDEDNDGVVFAASDPVRDTKELVSSGTQIVHGDTWVSDSLHVRQLPPETDVDARVYADTRAFDVLEDSPPANGTHVASWKPRFAQMQPSARPLFFRYGGPKDGSYVRFEHGQSMEGGAGSCPGLPTDGWTIACAVRFPVSSQQQSPLTWALGGGSGKIELIRAPLDASATLRVTDDAGTVLASLTSVANAAVSDTWMVLSARWRPADQTLDLFRGSERLGRTTLTSVPSTWLTYRAVQMAGNGLVDVAAVGVWDRALTSDALEKRARDAWIHGTSALRTDGTTRLYQSIEGGVNIKSTGTYTLNVQRYPPVPLTDGSRHEVVGSTYGNGLYVADASGSSVSRDAFSGPAGSGWTGTVDAYASVTGLYRGIETTPVIAPSETTLDGEWIQMRLPDDVVPVRYVLAPSVPSTAPGTPTSWTMLGSTDGTRWTVLDSRVDVVSFPSTFDVTNAQTVGFRWLRWVVTKVVASPTAHVPVSLAYLFVDGRSRDLLTCQNDTVVVLDRLGVGVHRPAAPLHVTGRSVLSGIKIVPRMEDGPWTGTMSAGPWTPSTANTNNISYGGGYVGIGTTAPQYPLHVVGAGNATSQSSYSLLGLSNVNNGGFSGATSGTGFGGLGWSAYFSSSVLAREYHAFSDARLKTDIERLTPSSCLARALALLPVSYRYASALDDPQRRAKLGVIAQDVEIVVPEAVKTTTRSVPSVNARVAYRAGGVLVGKWDGLAVDDVLEIVKRGENDTIRTRVLDVLDHHTMVEPIRGSTDDDHDDEVFVIGKVVDDCRTVDTDQLVALLVGCVHELSDRLERLERCSFDHHEK